jgi:hypothetical protein
VGDPIPISAPFMCNLSIFRILTPNLISKVLY